MKFLIETWNRFTGLFGVEPVEDCGCAGRARRLFTAMGYVHCDDDKVYTWRDFKIKDAGVEERHTRATLTAIFIRIMYPTWPEKP